jgi:fatty acid desaturase
LIADTLNKKEQETMPEYFTPKTPEESRAEFEASLQRIERAQRREQWIRYAAVLVGVLLILGYVIIAAITGLWGLGLLIVPFSVWLILVGIGAITAAFFADHS